MSLEAIRVDEVVEQTFQKLLMIHKGKSFTPASHFDEEVREFRPSWDRVHSHSTIKVAGNYFIIALRNSKEFFRSKHYLEAIVAIPLPIVLIGEKIGNYVETTYVNSHPDDTILIKILSGDIAKLSEGNMSRLVIEQLGNFKQHAISNSVKKAENNYLEFAMYKQNFVNYVVCAITSVLTNKDLVIN